MSKILLFELYIPALITLGFRVLSFLKFVKQSSPKAVWFLIPAPVSQSIIWHKRRVWWMELGDILGCLDSRNEGSGKEVRGDCDGNDGITVRREGIGKLRQLSEDRRKNVDSPTYLPEGSSTNSLILSPWQLFQVPFPPDVSDNWSASLWVAKLSWRAIGHDWLNPLVRWVPLVPAPTVGTPIGTGAHPGSHFCAFHSVSLHSANINFISHKAWFPLWMKVSARCTWSATLWAVFVMP